MNTGLFSPHFHLQTISPLFEFAQTKLCLKDNIWDFGVRPVLNLPADKGKRGENEMGANNFSYKVYKCEIYKQHQYMNNSLEKLLKTALIKNIINSNEFYKFQPLKK